MKPILLNSAEAIIEPFWDPELRELDKWEISLTQSTGTKWIDWWCSFNFEWQNSQQDQPVLSMTRKYESAVEISGYDFLLFSVMVPTGCRIALDAETEAGWLSFVSEPFGKEKRELHLPLQGRAQLLQLKITVLATKSSSGMGWFNWIGLQNSKKLENYLALFQNYDENWEGSLYPLDIPLSFQPKYEIFLSSDQLNQMRAFYQEKKAAGAPSPFAPDTEYDKYWHPEECIHDYVNFWDDTRYSRERDNGKFLIRYGVRAALYGVLEKDAESLRLAARYAMSILSCTHWDDGMICDFPVGSWEHRCFVQSLCLYDLVFIYDLAHEFFTPSAKSRLFRRLAEEGIASINFITWKHEYIFHNNQLVWFSHGRMAAYALLKKEWPRVTPYMEQAYQDVVENIQNTVLPDGGYVEGPTYFYCVGQNGGQALSLYARAFEKNLAEITPRNLQASIHFADALFSTDPEQDMIPICDAHRQLPQSHLAFMTNLLPDSAWNNMFWKSIERSGGLANDYFALLVQSTGVKRAEKYPSFVHMPNLNLVSSYRMWKGKPVKMVVLGNRSGASHTHEDKGSFILEYAGQTFAMDPGTCDYSSPFSMLYKYCQRHNVLVPVGSRVRAAAENPCMAEIPVEGSGDSQQFYAALESGKAYPDFYKTWNRQIESDTPGSFTVIDTYELKLDCGCDRVEFLWNTMLPVEQKEDSILIRGINGTISIWIPEGCECEIRSYEMHQGDKQNQIAFIRRECSGTIRTTFMLD